MSIIIYCLIFLGIMCILIGLTTDQETKNIEKFKSKRGSVSSKEDCKKTKQFY